MNNKIEIVARIASLRETQTKSAMELDALEKALKQVEEEEKEIRLSSSLKSVRDFCLKAMRNTYNGYKEFTFAIKQSASPNQSIPGYSCITIQNTEADIREMKAFLNDCIKFLEKHGNN